MSDYNEVDHPFDDPKFQEGLEAAGYLHLMDVDLSESSITRRFKNALDKLHFAAHSEAMLRRCNNGTIYSTTIQFFNEKPVSHPYVHIILGELPLNHPFLITPMDREPTEWTPIGYSDDGTLHFRVSPKGFLPFIVVYDSNPLVNVMSPAHVLIDDEPLEPSQASSVPSHNPFDIENVPNLTTDIDNIEGPQACGSFCDIYSGLLRGVERVAMKCIRLYATKELMREAKKKFRREVSVWHSLQHPNVLPFLGTCEIGDFRLVMVSPWAEGGTSLEYLKRYPHENRSRILWQTASALRYLHSARDAPQVVHGDLKADNVLISATGDALLGDFGLSRHVEEIVSRAGTAASSAPGGHARFMAPELIVPLPLSLTKCRPTPESDVYAFASLMLQIYTDQLPFSGMSEVQAVLAISRGEIPSRPVETEIIERGLGDDTWTLMTQCWLQHPDSRPRMMDVANQLSNYDAPEEEMLDTPSEDRGGSIPFRSITGDSDEDDRDLMYVEESYISEASYKDRAESWGEWAFPSI